MEDEGTNQQRYLSQLDMATALVNFLLANGSDVNLKTGFPDLCTSPLLLALEKGHHEVIKALLAHGADVDDENLREAILQCNKKALEMLIAKYGIHKCKIDLLELAAEAGDTEISQMLLGEGLDQEQALLKAIEHGKAEIVTLLLAHGTDPDIPSIRESAIDKAIFHRHIGIMEVLLHHGAKIYPEALGSAKLFAPEHIVKLAEQFPVHSLHKKAAYPALYNV